MSQRFAAEQALQLLQSIALESFDSEYSNSEFDEVNLKKSTTMIADFQNEEYSYDSDDKFR